MMWAIDLTRSKIGLNPDSKWFKIWWMVHGGIPVEFFRQTHQAHPKLPEWLVCLLDSLPSDVARGHQFQGQWLSAFLSVKTRKMRPETHWKEIYEIISKLPYVQVKRSIKKSIRSKFIRPLTLVLIFWERKVIAEPFFWGSVGDEFNSSFKIYHIGTHPAAAFHRSWKKVNQKVAKKKVL